MKRAMKTATIGLLGNPNSGKSTVFNALTGARQAVGNWPGVTVERRSGHFDWQNWQIEVVDLPGIYNLTVASEHTSIDARIACEALLSDDLDVIVNIVDASNLERNLYLTTQLLEIGVPVILVVNMMDIAKKRHIKIDLSKLAAQLKCPVIAMCARKKTGIRELKDTVVACGEFPSLSQDLIQYPDLIEKVIGDLQQQINLSASQYKDYSRCLALRLLEGDALVTQLFEKMNGMVTDYQMQIHQQMHEEIDIIFADTRYTYIHQLCQQVLRQQSAIQDSITKTIDDIVLNRVLGIPLFLAVMYFMFFFAINVGGAFQDFFDISSNAIFVQGLTHLLELGHIPGWITAVIASGLGKGINTTISFIPIIGSMFLFLSFLEASGYMARATFVMDRCMRALGLPGKSFVPMIVGFGCNVPAIMGARTLENKRDRILTIMMSPFMSCGARLAIYAVFTAAFFPKGGQNIVFALYMIGILMAVLTGFILRKTVLKGEPSPLVMELPPYHMPTLLVLVRQTWYRLKNFLLRAGKVILPVCILIGALNAISIDGSLNKNDADASSVLSVLGRAITPMFAPMGITQNNWPATVGLISGVLAKEVVVGTLNTLYAQAADLQSTTAQAFHLGQSLQNALLTIPENLMGLKNNLGNPVLANAPIQDMNQAVLGVMYTHFDGQLGAMAYLLFVLLYFPCVSATAAIMRELNQAWAVFSMAWSTGLAYIVAVTFYQAATFFRHPTSSTLWILTCLALFLVTLWVMRVYANQSAQKGINHANC